MNEGGANQPAPLVHNGVIYLNNPGNIMQAIDGKTGDLIWENRYGTNANAAPPCAASPFMTTRCLRRPATRT